MIRAWAWVRGLQREAALDSVRNVLAVLGVGTLLGDFFTMRWFYVFPALALLGLVWYVDYWRHDFIPPGQYGCTHEESIKANQAQCAGCGMVLQ